MPFASSNLLSRHVSPCFTDNFRSHFPFHFSFHCCFNFSTFESGLHGSLHGELCSIRQNLLTCLLSYFTWKCAILLPWWRLLVMAYSPYPMVWDLQGMLVEVGWAKLWCCAPQVCSSCKDLRQLTPSTNRLMVRLQRGLCLVQDSFQEWHMLWHMLVGAWFPVKDGRTSSLSSSTLKHVAEVCCTRWNFPLVGVRTNSAISGYLHILVCSHFILAFYRIAMSIFPFNKFQRKCTNKTLLVKLCTLLLANWNLEYLLRPVCAAALLLCPPGLTWGSCGD